MLDFKLPEVGENIKSGTAVRIAVSIGSAIKKGQTLLELETEKASLEVPSPCDGVIKEILVKENQEVKIGTVIFRIEESASAGSSGTSSPKDAPAKNTESVKSTYSSALSDTAAKTPEAPARAVITPITSTDVPTEAHSNVPASPTVRRLARELGINITQVPGSGPGGRISKEDVKAFTKQLISAGPVGGGMSVAARSLPEFSKWGNIERKPMNNIRKKTAEHLSYCWNTIPHVTQFDKADVTELDKLRKKYSTMERGLTITPFLLKVMAAALKQFPQFNVSVDMSTHEIIQKNYFNIGVAVDTDRGLIVPVIKNVDQKSIFQLTDDLKEISQKARDRKITLEEMQGGCLTLTNLGGIGGTYFTPIVNWPEVAILGISRGGWEPVWENGQFISRFKLPISLSYDHRVIDGADGARFTRWIADALEQPFLMELEK